MNRSHHPRSPLRVALAGFGVVGQGVYERLVEDRDRFAVVGIACRDPDRHIRNGAPAALVTTDAEGLPAYDILVEAIGGVAPADRIVLGALSRGADVVSANKTLVSRRFAELHEAAERANAKLLFSAAVGGGVPMLEAAGEAARRGAVYKLEAVVNGTTNFVLDRIGAGISVADAIRLAQEAGFAEADPSADIDGVDAAEKLSLLVRRAFGLGIEPDAIARDRLSSVTAEEIVAAQKSGAPYKQVARAERCGGGVLVEVRLAQQPGDSPLGKPKREENCLVIEDDIGAPTILHGKGAGRAPTAASVFSDLDALYRLHTEERAIEPV